MRFLIKLIGLTLVIVALLFGVLFAPRLVTTYRTLQDLRELAAEVNGWPRPAQVERLHRDVQALDDEVHGMWAGIRRTSPLLRSLQWLPRVGPTLAALPDVLEGGVQALHGARLLADVFLPIVPPQRPTHLQDMLPSLLAQASREDERLIQAENAFAEARRALNDVQVSAVLSPLRAPLTRARSLIDLAAPGVALLRLSPVLLGAGQERVWLVVAQNNEELRPTGGFISAVGEIHVRDGNLGTISFADSYRFFSSQRSYPPAPPDMQRMLETQILLLRDANWWLDVPTSARMVARFYQVETGREVDGVVFVDLEAVRLLVDGMGGIVLPDGTRVEADNVLPYVYEAWNRPRCSGDDCNWWRKRKDFLNLMAAAMLRKVQDSPRSIPPLRFTRRLVQALDEHHIVLVSLDDPHAEAIIACYGWDAAMRPGRGDYLRVVETNVGFNKANAKVQREITYQVNLKNPQEPVATLTIRYTHTAPKSGTRCYHAAYYGRRYEDMQNRCYWNYLRVAVPRGVRMLEHHGTRAGTFAVTVGDKGTTEFAGLVVIPPGERRTVTFRYILPPQVAQNGTYVLRLEKQPGLLATPFTLALLDGQNPYTTTFPLDSDMDLRLPVASR